MPSARSTVRADRRDVLTDAGLDALWEFVGIADASLVAAGADVTLPQFRVLTVIARHGPLTVAALARLTGVAPSTATRMCDRLARLELLERSGSTIDRRVVSLSLTPQGARLVDRVTAWRRRAIAAAFDAIDADRRELLADALSECATALASGGQPLP